MFKPLVECEEINNRIPRTLLNKELKLFGKRWFDYRELHPVNATILFGYIYTAVVRKTIREHIDPALSKVTRTGFVKDWYPIKDGDIFTFDGRTEQSQERQSKRLNSTIKARQFADSIMCPYDIFCKEMVRSIYFGHVDRIYRKPASEDAGSMSSTYHALSPRHLNNAILQRNMTVRWGELIQARMRYSQRERYKLSNGCQHPDIQAHRDFVKAQILRKVNKKLLADRFLSLDVISQEDHSEIIGK